MRIAVTGAYGQLGKEICRQIGDSAIPLDVDSFDLTDDAAVISSLVNLHPDVVIHCAAYIQVDKAETEPELCRAVNAVAVESIVRACAIVDCPLVQISTDYVFGAKVAKPQPWREDDPTSPQGVYACTKLEGETAAAKHPKHLIVRTCGLYAKPSDQHANNFAKTMLRFGAERSELRVVADQHCTPTYVPHLARAILFLVTAANRQQAPWGIYHITNTGQTTWHEFATEMFRLAGMNVQVHAISSADYGLPAARPSFSVLDTSRYHRLGGPAMPDWHKALAEYIAAWNAMW
jgi:dTDP-4-dehydrorhamnose reductase